jgi:hypothetical protein
MLRNIFILSYPHKLQNKMHRLKQEILICANCLISYRHRNKLLLDVMAAKAEIFYYLASMK